MLIISKLKSSFNDSKSHSFKASLLLNYSEDLSFKSMYYLTRTDQFNLNEWLYNEVKTMYLVNNFNRVTSIFILIDVRIGSKSGFAVLQNLQKNIWLIFDCKADEYYLQSTSITDLILWEC